MTHQKSMVFNALEFQKSTVFKKLGFKKRGFLKANFSSQNFRGWDYSIFSLHGSGVFEDTDPEKIKSKHVLHAPDTGNHQNSSNFQKFQIRLNKRVQNSVEFSKKTNEILLKITILIENDQCWSKLITIIILIIPETTQRRGGHRLWPWKRPSIGCQKP